MPTYTYKAISKKGLIVRNKVESASRQGLIKMLKDNNLKNYYGIFSGLEERITDTNFKGANIYSIFGGVDLDLRELELKEDITINAYSIFGGTSIFVNDNFKVKFNSFSLFGGNENKSITTDKKKVSTLTINCISIFGGTEVK